MSLKLLYRDEYFIAIEKPAGYHVHPHEDKRNKVAREHICLYLARDLIGQHVYPVHRLDAGTSGVLLFALSSESARVLATMFAEREMHKTYHVVVRGFVNETGEISLPLESDSTGTLLEAQTLFRRLAQKEIEAHIRGNRFPTARYSLVEAKPVTGRWHQLRRHFARLSHPVLGDSTHGDTRHNLFFRQELGIEGLCLKAHRLEFTHPWSQSAVKIEAPLCRRWEKIADFFEL